VSLTSHWKWILRQAAQRLWLTVVLYVLAAFVSILLGAALSPLVPDGFRTLISADAVDRVLGILASSMLAVTTFSLATMVTAHGTVTSSTSPRATTLVLDNEVTRHALGVFIGSFLFSLVGILALKAGVTGDSVHVALFVLTVVVIVLIVVALLRWIEHLSQCVRVSETTDRVEAATLAALEERARRPGLGGRPCDDIEQRIPRDARTIRARQVGYVLHIDMMALIALVQEQDIELFVQAGPGSFLGLASPLISVAGEDAAKLDEDTLCDCFFIGASRTFDYDPNLGFIVLAEIASRALSPGINDSGTAIDVIGRATRLLSRWVRNLQDESAEAADVEDRVWLPSVDVAELMDDVFSPIARDGAANISVQMRLQKALGSLAELGHEATRDAAIQLSQQAWYRARNAMDAAFDRDALEPLVLSPSGGAQQD
jgi:uncharacterized membrane protein